VFNGKAEDEASDDSSVVQLPVSDSESVKCQMWTNEGPACGKPATVEAKNLQKNEWYPFCNECGEVAKNCGFETRKLSAAPQRSGGERRKLNDKLTALPDDQSKPPTT
jgi:hypothetical protein